VQRHERAANLFHSVEVVSSDHGATSRRSTLLLDACGSSENRRRIRIERYKNFSHIRAIELEFCSFSAHDAYERVGISVQGYVCQRFALGENVFRITCR